MSIQQVKTLKLMGGNSIYFFNALFRPSDEEIRRHDELIKTIDSEIKIIDTQNGFKAEIKSLDLKF